MTDKQKKWYKAALIRVLYTFLEVALGYLTVGAAISEIHWGLMLSTSAVAALYSIVKSLVVGLPEIEPSLKPKDEDKDE